MDSLRLTYPTQQKGQHLLVETEPSSLRKWLRSLPYGDMGRAVPEVSRAVASLNRSEVSLSTRKELVSLFDTTYGQIFDAYRPNAPHIINDDIRRKEHDNLHTLTREMSFAHKIIADEERKKKKLWGKSKDLARSINLALHYLGLLLMEHYETYSPIPLSLWRECNNLFGFALSKKLENIEVFPDNYNQCLASIELTFVRNCLMSLSDPYHLSQGEHWQMFKYLEMWAHLPDLSEDPKDLESSQCFIIDLNGQAKPSYHSLKENREGQKDSIFLLTHDLVRQLRYQHESFKTSTESPPGFYRSIRPGTALSLIERMSKHWNAKVERKGQRYPVLTKLDVIWGIHAIHTLLSKHIKSPDSTHWDTATITAFLEQEHKVGLNWDALNVGSGGVGISTHKNIAHRLKVGELVMIREYVDQKPSYRWRPAICRWLYGDKNNGTKAGLEFIEGNISPCRLLNKMSKSKTSLGQVALMLKDSSSNSKTELLATRGTHKDGRDFLLKYHRKIEDIKSRKRSLVTPCIEIFSYQSYEVTEVEEPTEKVDDDLIPWTSVPKFDDGIDSKGENIDFDSIRLPGDH